MRINPIIERLRDTLGDFSQRIYGAAEWQLAEDKSRLQLPSLFVIYGGSQADIKIIGKGNLDETLTEKLQIIAIVPMMDRTGKDSQDALHVLRSALFRALLNYQYDLDANPLAYAGDKMIHVDKARYFHEFTFLQIGRLEEEDGVVQVFDNLDSIYADWNLKESDEIDHPDAQDQVLNLYLSIPSE